VLLPEQGHCPNPLRLSQALAERLRAGNARFVAQKALGFEYRDGGAVHVLTDGERIEADAFVIAAGAHSKDLTLPLGHSVPLETERGYHVMLAAPTVAPKIPVMSGEGKYFCTPMEGGLRIAGTVELAGLHAPPNFRRADALLARSRELLPDLAYGNVERWMGHRPSLPDSLPVIGRSPTVQNVFFAFGHGHVGLTAAAPTAEIVADLITGAKPAIDVSAFDIRRF